MIFVYRTSAVGPSGIPLSDYAEGDIIKLNESGSPVEFYVAKHDYESALNGAGRTLVVRKDIYDERPYDSSSEVNFAKSEILSFCVGDYKLLLDTNVQQEISTTTYQYTTDKGQFTTRSDSVFLLSVTELGEFNQYANEEGSTLPISDILQIAYLNGVAKSQWTRTPRTYNYYTVFRLGTSGSVQSKSPTSTSGSRPCFTLPSTLLFNPDTNEVVA